MIYKNFKEDFSIEEKFYVDSTQVAVPNHVRIKYFTSPSMEKIVAERNGSECRNCKLSEDGMSLVVPIPLHSVFLGLGPLRAIVTEIVEDSDFPDGERHTPVPKETGIILYEGISSDADTVESVTSAVLYSGGSAVVSPVTHAELVSMRDSGALMPGCRYRITDYVTSSGLTDTKTTGYRFDIIVTALTTDSLSEIAEAAKPSSGGNPITPVYASWQLRYSIDNDTARFSWASDNGKGVIYRMVDEYGNDCPYDFKNIKMLNPSGSYVFTFGSTTDDSLQGASVGNVMGAAYSGSIQVLNYNTFDGAALFNSLDKNCTGNRFGNKCERNKLGLACKKNVFGKSCKNNFLTGSCESNVFGNTCMHNRLGLYCHKNTVGNECRNSSFGNYCINNVFGVSASDPRSYFRYIILEHGVEGVILSNSETASSSYRVQNYRITSGTADVTVEVSRGIKVQTIVAVDSAGTPTQIHLTEIYG